MNPEDIPAAEANRSFSRVLREVRENQASFVVTAHGKPVARILPCTPDTGRAKARTALLARLDRQPVTEIGRWSRDDLYER
jgi:prevent-host-death family protein